MRWVTYLSPKDGRPHAGLVEDGVIFGHASSLQGLVEQERSLEQAAETCNRSPVEVVPLAAADLLAPIPRPPSVRDFMAFEEHAVTALSTVGLQLHPNWYQFPAFYFSNPAAVLGPMDPVPVPPGCSAFDFELEVAAVVGRASSDLTPEEAEAAIAGYTVMCDWSARDLQLDETPLGLGPVKAKDTATTLGPMLVTPDEIAPRRTGHGYDLAMSASVNGNAYSSGTWATIYWSFAEMLAYASRGTTLRPGDVVGSGTVGTGCIIELSGVHGRDAYPWLQVGDEVTLEVEELGSLTVTITPGVPAVPLR